MHTRALIGAAGLAGVTIFIGQMSVDAVPDKTTDTNPFVGGVVPTGEASGSCVWDEPSTQTEGSDVIPGDLQSTRWWATNGTETAYTFGTTSCNIGNDDLDWAGSPNFNHPVISQNMFRLDTEKSRFMQIGQAWLKHSFCALQQGICGDCNPRGGGCKSVLHPCCSDPYTASRNGSQGGLGPKWEVNAHTGDFELPWGSGEGTSGSYRRRLRVLNTELDAPNSLYFIEGMYVAKDDAADGNQNNNASYRRVNVGPSGSNYPLSFPSGTQRSRQGIQAWDDFTTTAQIVEVQVDEDGIKDPIYEDGLMLVGFDVLDNGDGTYNYEYAVQNMNSHRSARSFEVEVPAGVVVTGVGFHDVDYHSGDGPGDVNYDGTDWVIMRAGDTLRWEIDPTADGVSANALRWGTLYNFYFVADSAPTPGDATIGLYREDPSNPDFNSVSTVIDVPAPVKVGCPADIDMSGAVDFGDVLAILAAWGNAGGPEDIDGSGFVDFGDILDVLKNWGPCP